MLYRLHTCGDGQVHGTCETNDNYNTGRPGILERWAVTFTSLAEMRRQVLPQREDDGFPAVVVVLDGIEQ